VERIRAAAFDSETYAWAHSIDGGAYGEEPRCHRGIRRGLSFREWLATVEVMTGQESVPDHSEPVRTSCDEALRLHRARAGDAEELHPTFLCRRFRMSSIAFRGELDDPGDGIGLGE
jgi:hypothetical protein